LIRFWTKSPYRFWQKKSGSYTAKISAGMTFKDLNCRSNSTRERSNGTGQTGKEVIEEGNSSKKFLI
jgi:hypothetical protein